MSREINMIEEEVTVTQTDIKKGKKSADSCPVARAMNRTLRIYGATVVVSSVSGFVDVFSRRGSGKHHLGNIDMPSSVCEFSHKFWNDKKVEPFNFMIKFWVTFS